MSKNRVAFLGIRRVCALPPFEKRGVSENARSIPPAPKENLGIDIENIARHS